MQEELGKEVAVHGTQWNALHNGYFSNPEIANYFLPRIKETIALAHPDVIVDLGGGTGFLLEKLIRDIPEAGIRLLNLDCSEAQLSVVQHPRISCLRTSIMDFRRNDAGKEIKQLLFIMRSLLHYFGKEGLIPLLNHLRLQMKKGEFFLHQSACFENSRDAECINLLYKLMNTKKYYFTTRELCHYLEKTGWNVVSISSAPKLSLSSCDLARRYDIGREKILEVGREIMARFGEMADIFKSTPYGFCAYLHYRIFICRAI
ncbi:MAG: class I SAM-dependent methyltransferase [Caldiserica bacterium]|nr:class I SAM-dependent methyltransferase [Caldisericota bacterium]